VVTILRESGFRVVIYLDDHKPAHVHVIGAGEAKIDLGTAGGAPELVWAVGMSRADLRKAMRIVEAHRDHLIERWSDVHG
jgi:hypothetical protein